MKRIMKIEEKDDQEEKQEEIEEEKDNTKAKGVIIEIIEAKTIEEKEIKKKTKIIIMQISTDLI